MLCVVASSFRLTIGQLIVEKSLKFETRAGWGLHQTSFFLAGPGTSRNIILSDRTVTNQISNVLIPDCAITSGWSRSGMAFRFKRVPSKVISILKISEGLHQIVFFLLGRDRAEK